MSYKTLRVEEARETLRKAEAHRVWARTHYAKKERPECLTCERTVKPGSKILRCRSCAQKGKSPSEEVRKKISETLKKKTLDENCNFWKGGKKLHGGYMLVKIKGSAGKYIREHRLVMEKKIGRPMKKKEVVHHWDENKLNNSPENLCLFRTNGAHSRLHQFAYRHNLDISLLKFEQPWFNSDLCKIVTL
jgi:hypothetical protein